MTFKFKPSDFEAYYTFPAQTNATGVMATIANNVLEAHLQTLPRVYGRLAPIPKGLERLSEEWIWSSHQGQWLSDTHTALLFGISELAKPECKHEPLRITCAEESGGMGEVKLYGFKPVCGKCGVPLEAKWEVRK